MTDNTEDKLASAKRAGQCTFDSIKEMVEALRKANDSADEDELESAEQAINEDPLSIQVRSDWHPAGHIDFVPAEYRILLCSGGPAIQIVGTLSEHCEPETARLEVQDWFQPWTPMRPLVSPDNYDSEPILLAYARCFYFGG